MSLTRRTLLRSSAAVAGGGLATSGLANATSGDASVQSGSGELSTESKDILQWQPHITVPGYDYFGSVDRGEFCYWATSTCIYLTALSIFAAGPQGAAAVGSTCGAQTAGCRLLDDLERLTVYEFEWVHVYRKQDWLDGITGFPKWTVVPEPMFDDTSDQKMVAEAIAGDDGKIDTGDLRKGMSYWSSGKTVPGTDHTVTTATMTLLIKFWATGNSIT